MGGSDMRIRYWDMVDKTKSFILSGAGCESIDTKNVSYQ